MNRTRAYAALLRIIAHPGLAGKKAVDAASPELHSLYCALLGVVEFLLLTRIDVAVFASALQQWCHAPKIIHVKRLSVLTKWTQANPKSLAYTVFAVRGDRQVGTGPHQRVFSDSAFKKEEQTGHYMRGVAYLLWPGSTDDAFGCSAACHLLDFVSRQRKGVRATFSAELMGACDSVGQVILLSQMLHGISTGDCSIDGSRQGREHGAIVCRSWFTSTQ